MKMTAGKYKGCELSDVPTDYLAWASSHMPLSAEAWDNVMAEQSRRLNAERVAAETLAQILLERPVKAFNKIAARIHLAATGY